MRLSGSFVPASSSTTTMDVVWRWWRSGALALLLRSQGPTSAQGREARRELRKLRPTVVHLVGHGASDGLRFQAADGRAQAVTAEALGEALGAAGGSVKLVVLRSGYSEAHAEILSAYVDCVVWIGSELHYEAARIFAVGFYGGLCECEPVAVAHEQGQAAINLVELAEANRPQLEVRDGDRCQ